MCRWRLPPVERLSRPREWPHSVSQKHWQTFGQKQTLIPWARPNREQRFRGQNFSCIHQIFQRLCPTPRPMRFAPTCPPPWSNSFLRILKAVRMRTDLFDNLGLCISTPLARISTLHIPLHFDNLPVLHGHLASAMDRTDVAEDMVLLSRTHRFLLQWLKSYRNSSMIFITFWSIFFRLNVSAR